MNPKNSKDFPIVSYVLSRLRIGKGHPDPFDPDIEQPPIIDDAAAARRSFGDELELVERMPHLKQPELLAAMATAVSEVVDARTVLHALGDRPDHEAVDGARVGVEEIDASLSRQLDEIVREPRPEGTDVSRWLAEMAERERKCRADAEAERTAFSTVISVDEMHEAYEKLLRDAEEKLLRMYRSVADADGSVERLAAEGDQVNEEVVGILQEASGRSLEVVDLSGRELRFLPEAFGRLQSLLSLNLSNNQLEVIPDSIAGLQHLEELRLSSNLLVSLPDSIGLLVNLKILDVSSNKLKALPDSISKCRSLVEVEASYNDLTYLPTNIGYEMSNLQKLSLYLNKLRTLPTSVCEMRALRHLDVHFNELRGLPHAIGNLANLEVLNLSSNFSDLKDLPYSMGDLASLRELDLSNNQIRALPDTFGRLEKLVRLNLDQNPLVMPPLEVAREGAEAVVGYMSKRWLDILLEEEAKRAAEENPQQQQVGWLMRSGSWLNNWVSGVSGGVAALLHAGDDPNRDPVLDEAR